MDLKVIIKNIIKTVYIRLHKFKVVVKFFLILNINIVKKTKTFLVINAQYIYLDYKIVNNLMQYIILK